MSNWGPERYAKTAPRRAAVFPYLSGITISIPFHKYSRSHIIIIIIHNYSRSQAGGAERPAPVNGGLTCEDRWRTDGRGGSGPVMRKPIPVRPGLPPWLALCWLSKRRSLLVLSHPTQHVSWRPVASRPLSSGEVRIAPSWTAVWADPPRTTQVRHRWVGGVQCSFTERQWSGGAVQACLPRLDQALLSDWCLLLTAALAWGWQAPKSIRCHHSAGSRSENHFLRLSRPQ